MNTWSTIVKSRITKLATAAVVVMVGIVVVVSYFTKEDSERMPSGQLQSNEETNLSVSAGKKPPSRGGDVEGPEIESHLGDLDYMVGAFPPDNRPLIWAEYDDESGIDTESVRMFMDDKDITADCKVKEGKVSFKPAKTLKAPKLYEFKVIVSDKAGNRSELFWEILLKPC